MINKVKKFLTERRCKKLLKNNRGFSLLEVLVAVAIIGIISGIAVPQFTKYRNNASKVATETSGKNIASAFRNCLGLNTLGECDTLAKIGIDCPKGATCSVGKDSTNNSKFCAEIEATIGAKTYKTCVEVDLGTDKVIQKFGGTLVKKICKLTLSNCADDDDDGTHSSSTTCTKQSDCTNGVTPPKSCSTSGGTPVPGSWSCATPDDGDCDATAGTCS